MTDPRRISPLGHRAALQSESGALRQAERAFLGKFVLRVDPNIGAGPIKEAIGLELPQSCRSAEGDGSSLLWLGPDEWLIVADAEIAGATRHSVASALGDLHHQLTDVSDYYTTIEIAGDTAPLSLMKLTPLDLDARAFKQGQVAGSVFGKAQGVLHQRADKAGPVFDLHIRWSMADYLWCVLAEGGREFGLVGQTPAYKVPLRA